MADTAQDPARLKIVYRDPKKLKAYERNSRTHSDEQIEQLRASYREFGFTNPILLKDDGVTIGAGHARQRMALLEDIAKVPTIILPGLTEAQWRAYVIADNKLAENSGWDMKVLEQELSALKAIDFNLAVTGFDARDLVSFLAKKGGEVAPDELPEPVAPRTVAGDIWILGGHRIICGSSIEPEVVAALLGDAQPHLMVTDPPYGVEYDAMWRQRAGKGGPNLAAGKVTNDDVFDWREAWKLFPGSVAYVWHAGWFAGETMNSLKAVGFNIRAQIIWVKNRLIIGRGDYHEQKEPCFYAVQEGGDDHWQYVPEHEVVAYAVKRGAVGQYHGGRKQSTVWNIDHLASDTGHSTQKPIDCMKRPIENNSRAGDAVYDPFAGSGTTIIAAQMTARRCFAVEINPAYVDIAVERWQRFTGEAAIRERDGVSFDEAAG